MTGMIFNLQKFCVNDGPGIRTTVFFKGCPLKCIWCHNPESQSIRQELMYRENLCVNCLQCVKVCPQNCHSVLGEKHIFDFSCCISCGSCVNTGCNALSLSGRAVSVDDILSEVLKDKAFYENSGGGITLSGGEPLYQETFCLELMRRSKENGLHVCLETCGFASPETIKKTAEYVDIYLFDIKETNPWRHRQFTGVDNQLILENLKLLDGMGKEIILRCPIIPGCNDSTIHLSGIAQLANTLHNIIQIEVLPYHCYGEGKYTALGRGYLLDSLPAPEGKTVAEWIAEIQSKTNRKVVHR